MPRQLDRTSDWQTAHYMKAHFGVGPHLLKGLALDGVVRIKSDKSKWPSHWYSVTDVRAYVEDQVKNGIPDSHPMAQAMARMKPELAEAK